MSSDACLAVRALRHSYELPKIEMNIGHWYLDEFGNRTREIKARDAEGKVRISAQLEPRDRTKQNRTATARLAQLTAF
jgi:hypothetical protein